MEPHGTLRVGSQHHFLLVESQRLPGRAATQRVTLLGSSMVAHPSHWEWDPESCTGIEEKSFPRTLLMVQKDPMIHYVTLIEYRLQV